MPLSANAWSNIITAGSSLLNTGSQLLTNANNRKWALQDWNMQNAYNSPQQQMQRYKEAGLNPNLIYSQMSNGPAVRSTDAIAPKLDPDQLNVLAKSNKLDLQKYTLETMKQTIEGNQLKNDNQRIQNEILETTKNDLMEKPAIQNRIGNVNYDNLLEAANLKRLERSQFPIKTDILKQQLQTIATSNDYQKLNIMQKYDINELLKQQMKAITEGKVQQNTLNGYELDIRKRLEENVQGLGSGTAGRIASFLGDIFKVLILKK
jgi:hypothetical protein